MIDLIAAAAIAVQGVPPAAELGELSAHILSNRTGQFSEDISPPDSGGHWNQLFEGDDIVITQEVRTTDEQFIERPLRMVARVGRRILAQRTYRAILTTDGGRAFQHLVIPDSTCAGDIQVTVTYGTQTRSETLQMRCGE
ncbi:MAG TPA: hypothetical protein VEC11_05345 [Allosphingosinicella sp.]|nr:hypothetical protein [Allosphingosinicella sp.]